ncbi:hypothetical protein B566_EDAN002595 [Ephemera danica]|nr:hypothetical protein B566_EDAN002595 [Ephemera danica]
MFATAVTWLLLATNLAVVLAQDDGFLNGTFPAGFLWGTATSTYQIEGAWNESGKGESIWDNMVHEHPNSIDERGNGDVACDSYHLYEEDVQVVKEMGLHFYRFSLSWPRILPTGRIDVVNPDGINYYNRLIDSLVTNGIQPVVKNWITLNEPWVQAVLGYGYGQMAPKMRGPGRRDYKAGHNLIKAHARAWHIYNDTYRATQQGKVGITLNMGWVEPKTNSTEDIEATERYLQFQLGWFAHPIYTTEGDYPAVMKEYVLKHSLQEGFNESRLPEFGQQWIDYIKGTFIDGTGTYDFFGLNHYSTNYVQQRDFNFTVLEPSFLGDSEALLTFDPAWPESSVVWLRVVPWGFRRLLNWMRDEYGPEIPVFVTENGYADYNYTGLQDTDRLNYYTDYINEMMKAVVLDGCNVIAYAAWSAIDNFEWLDGYTVTFGLYNVDFDDPLRPRTAKDSSIAYTKIVADNGFPTGRPIKTFS